MTSIWKSCNAHWRPERDPRVTLSQLKTWCLNRGRLRNWDFNRQGLVMAVHPAGQKLHVCFKLLLSRVFLHVVRLMVIVESILDCGCFGVPCGSKPFGLLPI